MPRHTVGQSKSTGATRKLEVRMPDELRAAVQSVLRKGEKISELVRELLAAEVRRRQK